MLREVTFHDRTNPLKKKTTRQYLDAHAIELETISEISRKAKELSDVKCKVNFWSSQAYTFINRKVGHQLMIILNAKIFILIEKVAQRTFYPLNCCWNEFREKTACNN